MPAEWPGQTKHSGISGFVGTCSPAALFKALTIQLPFIQRAREADGGQVWRACSRLTTGVRECSRALGSNPKAWPNLPLASISTLAFQQTALLWPLDPITGSMSSPDYDCGQAEPGPLPKPVQLTRRALIAFAHPAR